MMSRRIVLAFLLLISLTSPTMLDAEPFQSRFGALSVTHAGGDAEGGKLTAGSRVVGDTEWNWSVSILGVFDWGPKGDIVLLALKDLCSRECVRYQIIRLTADATFASSDFGDYGYSPSDFQLDDGGLTFRMRRDYPANIDHWTVLYNGTTVNIVTVLEDDTGVLPAGAGQDVSRWNGKWASELFEDPSERARLRTIIPSAEDLNDFRTSMTNFGKFSEQDGYLIAKSCWPHFCDTRFGYLAIEITTGRPYAAYWHLTEGINVFGNTCDFRVFGTKYDDLPAPMRSKIEEVESEAKTYAGPKSCQKTWPPVL